jgi:hypothetical protein
MAWLLNIANRIIDMLNFNLIMDLVDLHWVTSRCLNTNSKLTKNKDYSELGNWNAPNEIDFKSIIIYLLISGSRNNK